MQFLKCNRSWIRRNAHKWNSKWIYDLCHICFNIAWVDRDSGPHFCTKMKESVWSEAEIDFVAALREISHLRHVFAAYFAGGCCPAKRSISPSSPARNPAETAGIEIPKCQHAPPNAQKTEPKGLSQAQQKMGAAGSWGTCWADARLQDCTCATKKVLPKFLEFSLEFGEIASLAARLRQIACSLCSYYFPSLLKQVISSQAQQNKHWMMWLSTEMYRVCGGCRTRDAKNIWPNRILLLATVTIFVGLIWPPSSRPFMASLPQHFTPSCANAWTALASLLNGWGKLVLCESTDWHHQRRNTIQVMTMRKHNHCRDPTIVALKFRLLSMYASARVL